MAGRRPAGCGALVAVAAATATALIALATSAAAMPPPQLQMVQATVVLPSLLNSSADVPDDIFVAVQLLGAVPHPVTARLDLLLPPRNSNSSPSVGPPSGSGAVGNDSWLPADPDELWLEPSSLTWSVGEPAGAKHVRLRSAAALPLSYVLEDALYSRLQSSSNSTTSGSSASSIVDSAFAVQSASPAGGSAAQSSPGQPLLRVELAAASGAAINSQRCSTVLVADLSLQEETEDAVFGAGSLQQASTGSGSIAAQPAPEPDDLSPPLFGFIANQAAYPPHSSTVSSASYDSGNTTIATNSSMASIPVRFLAGQLREPAVLKYTVRMLDAATAAAAGQSNQQFLPIQSRSGVLTFLPAASGSGIDGDTNSSNSNSNSSGSHSSSGPGGASQPPAWEQQLVFLPIAWDRLPPGAEYHLGLELEPLHNARVAPQPEAVALHIFGTPLGTCPPGSALANSSGDSSSGGAGTSPDGGLDEFSPVSSSDNATAVEEEAGFGLVLNGTILDLSSTMIHAGATEYAAMVESDVSAITLCLRTSTQGRGSVHIVPAAGRTMHRGVLPPAADAFAAEACGCGDGQQQQERQQPQQPDGGATCDYSAWVLPLLAGQNQFTVSLPTQQSDALALAPAAEQPIAAQAPAPSTSLEQHTLAVIRLADPQHAELESIIVKSSDDTAAMVCGPAHGGHTGGGRKRTALDTGDGPQVLVLPTHAANPCQPDELITVNVSDSARMISLTPALKHPFLLGIRVEVNGQVLSRGGDVAADQLEDTTAAQQKRSNAAFLPSAFILGLQPGSRLDAEIVVVAEDGVTTRRYPIRFVVVGSSKELAVAAAGSSGGSGSNSSATAAAHPGTRPKGWPLSPAMQAMCSVCPAGWAAGTVNSTACHMCPPGTYSPSEQYAACQPCQPGTFAYSWGSSYCKNCIQGTYAATASSALCAICPANTTTAEDGQSRCDMPLLPGTYQQPRYAVVVSFWVLLTGLDPQDVVVRAGVNAAPDAIIISLIRADTAQQFNISIDDVQVVSLRQVARRSLSANVTATLGVDVPAGATDDDIAAALEVAQLSADDPIDMLSTDPDRFFGRTTKTLEVQVQSAVEGTKESRPGGTNLGLLWGIVVPGILAIIGAVVLVTLGCRKSRACRGWRKAAARRLATTRLAPRAVAYTRYSGGSATSGDSAA